MKRYVGFFLVFFFSVFLGACRKVHSEAETKNDTTFIYTQTTHGIRPEKQTKTIPVANDTLNQIAQFLAGKPTVLFKKQQQNANYRNFQHYLQTTDNTVLQKITTWQNKNLDPKNNTLFYPFSGPDFKYAHLFFPNKKNYILFGLEKIGTLPQIQNLSKNQLAQYSQNLQHALRYIDKVGYFTTNQMRHDFEKVTLDGVLHILLHYLASARLIVEDFSYIQINSFGKTLDILHENPHAQNIQGIRIGFKTSPLSETRTVYYFPLDVSNTNLIQHPEFLFFLNNFGPKDTYMKAASYIFRDARFSVLRNITLKQSQLILQDDTGIAYETLRNEGFHLQLFGTYTRTIDEFKHFFQPALADQVKTSAKTVDFKIGYNSWHNEMLLMLCTKTADSKNLKPTPLNNDTIYYRVQIKASNSKISTQSPVFKGLHVSYYYESPWYKYTIGNQTSRSECIPLLKKAHQNGFVDAFIVGIQNGKRVYIDN